MYIKKFFLNFLFIILILINSGCRLFNEKLNFTYEGLSEDLLRIEYAELTSRETGLISDYERNIILILEKEETEYVLQEVSKITFKTSYGNPAPVEGKTFIFVYEEYELWIRQWCIEYNWFEEYPEDTRRIYFISKSIELENLVEYIDSEFVQQ